MSLLLPPIILTPTQYRQIQDEGVKAYPNECCGILFGKDVEGRRVVERLMPVPNDFDSGEQYHRFSISSKLLMQAEQSASEAGDLVLGFYHSHPDHPAKPSEYDRTHSWPFYSYIIVAIEKRMPGAMTSWLLNETNEAFEEQAILQGNP
jgi:proteasome lid subunit RPN8/RPN11